MVGNQPVQRRATPRQLPCPRQQPLGQRSTNRDVVLVPTGTCRDHCLQLWRWQWRADGSGGGSGATRPAKCRRSASTRWAASRPWANTKQLRSIPRAAAARSNSSKIWAARGSHGKTQRSSAHESTVSGSRWILGVLSRVKRDTQAALTGPALNRIRSSRLQIVLTSASENSVSGPWAMSLNGCS